MTPAEIKWTRGDIESCWEENPLGPDWTWAWFRAPDGTRYLVNYWVGHQDDRRASVKPYAIDAPLPTGEIHVDYALWVGDTMLELMCAIEEHGLTPEVTYENLG